MYLITNYTREQEEVLSKMSERAEMLQKYLYIAFVVALYWTVSISMVFVNKALLSSDNIHLDAPLFITWFQCVCTVLICLSFKFLSILQPSRFCFPQGSPLAYETMRKVVPLSVLFISMISFNNLCLKYVGVAFYYIGRSLTTVFNVAFTYLLLGEKTCGRTIGCCATIIFGFWLGVDQENLAGSLSIWGTVFGVLGSLSLSLYSIQTKKVLPYLDQDIWLLSYYNNLYSVILFLPLILLTDEFPKVYNYDKLLDLGFWSFMILSGVCGFAIGYVTTLQIKVTSPLTHNVSGTAKACVQTVVATHWYDESKSVLWWTSNVVVLVASAAYARVKQMSMAEARAKRAFSSI